jgi:hypothetical protein
MPSHFEDKTMMSKTIGGTTATKLGQEGTHRADNGGHFMSDQSKGLVDESVSNTLHQTGLTAMGNHHEKSKKAQSTDITWRDPKKMSETIHVTKPKIAFS